MELFNPSYINYLLYSLVSIALIYLTGHLLIGAFCTNTNKNVLLFQKLFSGYVFLISLFAILWTSGNSVFLFSLILLIIYCYERFYIKKESLTINLKKIKRIELPQIGILFLFTIIFFSLSYYVLFNNGVGNIWCDYPVYATFSHNIEYTHIEGPSVFIQTMITDKYHYADIWANVFFSFLFNENYLHIYLLIVITLFAVLIFQGGIAIAQAAGIENRFLLLVFGILLIIIQPFIPFFNKFYFAFIDLPKLGGLYLFFIASGLLFIQKKYFLSALVLYLLIAFYTPVAPGIIGGLFVVILIVNYKNKFKLINRYIIYAATGIIFYVIFYFFINTGTIGHNASDDHSLSWALLFIIKKSVIYIFSFLLSLVLLLIIGRIFNPQFDKTFKFKFSFFSLIVFVLAGLLSSAIIAGLYSMISIEGSQLLKVFALPVFSIIYYIFIIILTKRISLLPAKIFSVIILIGFILNSLYNNSAFYFGSGNYDWEKINTEFYCDIKSLISNDNREFAYIRKYPEYNESFDHLYRIMSFPPMHKIIHYNGFYSPYCFSVYDIPDNVPLKYDDRHLSLFYQFVENQKAINRFSSITESQIDFIRKYNIGYIIVEKDASLPDGLLNLIDNKYVDNMGNTLNIIKK